MGKRNTQPSLKVAKKQPAHHFNALIKNLKPKVFITDSSNFLTLVQKLTGKGPESPTTASFPPPITMPVVSSEPITHVIQIDDHDDSPDPSFDYSSNPSLDYSTDPSLDYSSNPRLDYNTNPSLDYTSNPRLDYDTDPSFEYSLDRNLDCSLDTSNDYCSPDLSVDDMFMPFDYSNCSPHELVQWPEDRVVMDYAKEIELRNFESWLLDFDSPACIQDAPFVAMNTYEYNNNYSSVM